MGGSGHSDHHHARSPRTSPRTSPRHHHSPRHATPHHSHSFGLAPHGEREQRKPSKNIDGEKTEKRISNVSLGTPSEKLGSSMRLTHGSGPGGRRPSKAMTFGAASP